MRLVLMDCKMKLHWKMEGNHLSLSLHQATTSRHAAAAELPIRWNSPPTEVPRSGPTQRART